MAGNKSPYGLNAMTVQEATNSIAQRKVIRVSPTLAASAISGTAGDVLISGAEIPNAVLTNGGCSILKTAWVIDYDDVQTDEDFIVIFHQDNAADFGTPDATANISDANLKLNKLLGFKEWDNDLSETGGLIDNAKMIELQNASGTYYVTKEMMLQAESDSTSVYFSVIQKTTSGATPDWDTGDLEFVFDIEY